MTSDNDTILKVEGVKFRYSEESPLALRGIDLTIKRGEFVAFVGQNGAGKTTLAKHFNGLLLPTEGQVLVDGIDTRQANVEQLAKIVGYCYQNPDHQIFSTTIKAEISFGPKNLGMEGTELEEAVQKAVTLVGLEDQIETAPYLLGRGQRQKLAVASILAMDSPVLIVDEPTTGMDLRSSRSIMSLLHNWYEKGKTIIVITHDMNIVAEYVPETVVMTGGKILAKNQTRKIMVDNDLLSQAYLRPPQVTRLAKALTSHGIRPDALTVKELLGELKQNLNSHKPTNVIDKNSGE